MSAGIWDTTYTRHTRKCHLEGLALGLSVGLTISISPRLVLTCLPVAGKAISHMLRFQAAWRPYLSGRLIDVVRGVPAFSVLSFSLTCTAYGNCDPSDIRTEGASHIPRSSTIAFFSLTGLLNHHDFSSFNLTMATSTIATSTIIATIVCLYQMCISRCSSLDA